MLNGLRSYFIPLRRRINSAAGAAALSIDYEALSAFLINVVVCALATGPRLIFGGKALSQTGGHGDLRAKSDDHQPCCQERPDFARIADGVDAVRQAARDEFRKGAAH
jgi:imidazolonepropionase-like amidohydrolase